MNLWKQSEARARTKSPISDVEMPLLPAGTSLTMAGLETIMHGMLWWFLVALALGSSTEGIWNWALLGDRFPWASVCVFLPASVAFAAWKTRRGKAKLDHLLLGLRGERYVAGLLEALRPLGYLVLHDLPVATKEKDNYANIDHVIVGPAGVFAVETKAWSKPIGNNPKLHLNGERLVRSDRPLHPGQAKAPEQAVHARRRVAKILKAATGRDFPVTAILAVPGWWTEERHNTADLLALNPKRIGAVLSQRPELLRKDEVLLAHAQLQNHARAAMQLGVRA